MVYMYHSFLIHSSADGHLGCFHVLAIINSAAMNTGVHVSLSDLVSLVCMPRSGIARSYGSSISRFLRIDCQFFKHKYCYLLFPMPCHGQRSLMGYSPWRSRRVGHDWASSTCPCWQNWAYLFIELIEIIYLMNEMVIWLAQSPPSSLQAR